MITKANTKIEVVVGNCGPIVHILNKNISRVGKDHSCEINIPDREVSRKHLELHFVNGKVYLVDLGSTNGSYINDKKIVPGEKIEFHSFFPVRLGTNVLLTLLSENEVGLDSMSNQEVGEAYSSGDTTKVVSLETLRAATNKPLIKRSSVKKKKKVSFKKRFNLGVMNLSAIFIFFFAVIYTVFERSEVGTSEAVAIKELMEETHINPSTPKVEAIIPFGLIKGAFSEGKCMDPVEIELCSSLMNTLTPPWGAKILQKKQILIQVKGTDYYKEALKLLGTGFDVKKIEASAWEVAAAIFLLDGIKQDIDYKKIKNFTLLFALYSEQQTLKALVNISSESLENLKVLLVRRRLDAIKERGLDVLSFTEKYYAVTVLEGDHN